MPRIDVIKITVRVVANCSRQIQLLPETGAPLEDVTGCVHLLVQNIAGVLHPFMIDSKGNGLRTFCALFQRKIPGGLVMHTIAFTLVRTSFDAFSMAVVIGVADHKPSGVFPVAIV